VVVVAVNRVGLSMSEARRMGCIALMLDPFDPMPQIREPAGVGWR
jgi:hypothetical protein